MKDKLRLLPPIVVLLALLAAGWGLVHYESEYLWKVQELNLFLDTPLFLRQQMVTSGWLLTWLGCWLTEFFYHPWLGVGLLCALWALLMVVTWRAFRVSTGWAAVLLVPVALLLLTDVDLGYWVYYLKLRGHFFAATLGVLIAVAAVWAFRALPRWPYMRCAFVALSAAVLYPLAGFYGLLAALLMGVMVWRLEGLRLAERAVTSAVAVLAIVVVPLVCYRYVFAETNLVNIYWTGLPLFFMDESYTAYYVPYYLLVAFFLLLAATFGWGVSARKPRFALWHLGVQAVLVAVLVVGVCHFWYRDYNFHKELRMQQCVEQTDWEGVLREARDAADEPTRAIVMMKNLALFRLGRQGDEMYHYRTGAKASDTPIPVNMTQVAGRAIYYNYGQLNFCYRWCLEDGVEYGWRAEYLKYLVRCSLLNGEHRVAKKYIDLLRHTRYHREWADRYARFLGQGEALRANKEFEQIFHLMPPDDKLNSDNALVELYLMNQFIDRGNNDPIFQEQTLLSALWHKDIQMFWPAFFHYANLHPTGHMPTHYQEAAYLYGHLENGVDVSRMPFDPQVVKNYEDFMALAQRCKGMSEESMRPVFYPQFGKTFYYEYFLVRNQKLY